MDRNHSAQRKARSGRTGLTQPNGSCGKKGMRTTPPGRRILSPLRSSSISMLRLRAPRTRPPQTLTLCAPPALPLLPPTPPVQGLVYILKEPPLSCLVAAAASKQRVFISQSGGLVFPLPYSVDGRYIDCRETPAMLPGALEQRSGSLMSPRSIGTFSAMKPREKAIRLNLQDAAATALYPWR
ncbi:hypothetical protein AAFF_G00434130 [Aldrovandia affinis]|uniref:Uncharacterized protein n=1 Tax=Aldrovandia affinis TaxID=143900 RepID=A0AAD7WIX2_9TELE|nr:hypothetical protein AAFF_G00434130 [Aldrovandia affinis]